MLLSDVSAALYMMHFAQHFLLRRQLADQPVKRSSKPFSIITTRALNISKKPMLASSQRHSGVTKTMRKPPITWEIVTRITPYQPKARACMLCLTENCAILRACPTTSLNKKAELMGKYRHTNKFKSKSFS